jgi:hypothetical protein
MNDPINCYIDKEADRYLAPKGIRTQRSQKKISSKTKRKKKKQIWTLEKWVEFLILRCESLRTSGHNADEKD